MSGSGQNQRPQASRRRSSTQRRLGPPIVALAGSLVLMASALGIQGGFNKPTKKLEEAFKRVGVERARSDDGCYPSPSRMVDLIRRKGDKVATAGGFGGVNRAMVIYVINRRASCDRVVLALRAEGKLYVLDSARGPV
jgi:hypothetical protein